MRGRLRRVQETLQHKVAHLLEAQILKDPHSTKKNGITKRKNRHPIEIACYLMLNTNVPVHHWGDAVFTACFLINRISSSSFENKVPHSIIFPNDPLYHVSPSVFRCTCFVHKYLQVLTSFLQRILNVSFWDILTFKKSINVILLQSKGIICLLMLPILRSHFFFLYTIDILHLFNRFFMYHPVIY